MDTSREEPGPHEEAGGADDGAGWHGVPPEPPGVSASEGPAPEDRRPGFHGMDIVMALDMLLVVGILVASLVQLIQAFGGQEPQALGGDPHQALWINNAFVLLVFGAVPFLWVMATRVRPWEGTVRYFGLQRPLPRILLGIGIGLLTLIGAIVVGLIATAAGVEPENLAAETFSQAMTWPLVLGISFSAAFAEEIFFRGVLQKYLGWWGQAIVFAVPHIYEGVFAVFLILGVGLLFGWVVRKGGGLWPVIAAHFCFNFIQLSAIMVTR